MIVKASSPQNKKAMSYWNIGMMEYWVFKGIIILIF